jgi:hypothetical protein
MAREGGGEGGKRRGRGGGEIMNIMPVISQFKNKDNLG